MANPSLDDLLAALHNEACGQQATAYVRMLWETDRWSSFSAYAQTACNVERTFHDLGLADVQRVETPADGLYRVGDWVMPLAWECAGGTLRITSPAGSEAVIARHFEEPNHVGMWSGATPPGGVEAEVVLLEQGSPEEVAAKADAIRGKWVLTPGQARAIKKAAIDAGAIGIVTSWTRNPHFQDAVQWINGWSDKPGGWMFTAADTPLPCFAITREAADRLRSLQRKSGRVRLRGHIDARYYPGHLDYVTARIPGAERPEQEVIVLGHLYEQGANDNASGCATILEMARTLHALIESGRLPRPCRSIRFLLMAECYGSLGYAQDNRERLAETLACSCIDTGAGPAENARCLYQISVAPLCNRSYYEAVHEQTAVAYLNRYRPLRRLKMIAFALGTDQLYNDPLIGVPAHWSCIGTPDDLWHNSHDRLDTIDPRAYVDLACVEGAALYRIAHADDADAARFAGLTANHVKKLVLDLLAGGANRSAVEVHKEVGAAAILSARRLATGAGPIEQLARQFEEFVAAEAQIAQCPAGPEPGPAGRDVRRLVPVRNPAIIGSISLDPVPVTQWPAGGVAASPRWGGPRTLGLWWADGKRTVAEIERRVAVETPIGDVDLAQWFGFLAAHGYVQLDAS